MTVRISQAVGLFQTPPNGPKHNGPKSGTDHNDRDPDVVEFGMIPTVGAVYDRAFVRTALPCVLDVKNARSQTAPTVQSHSVFLESSDSHADIRISETTQKLFLKSNALNVLSSRRRSPGWSR